MNVGTGKEIFLAKRNKDNRILSLHTHLQDTMFVMKWLLDNYCSLSLYQASGIGREKFESLAVFVAGVHDIGKATKAFQEKIHGENLSFQHAMAGGVILKKYFHVDESICDVICAHHGKSRRMVDSFTVYFRRNKGSFGKNLSYWEEIFEMAVSQSGDGLDLSLKLPVAAQMLLTGLLIMADWIVSNEDYFPLYRTETDLLPNDYLIRRKKGIRLLDLPNRWEPDMYQIDAVQFQKRFGFSPNSVQSVLLDIVNHMSEPGILILESPTGSGKTEAALSLSEVMSVLSGSCGIFYGLPTKGTANGMLSRMLLWSDSVADGLQTSFRLAHSDAKNNTEYEIFCSNISDDSGITINDWLSGRHRVLLNNFCIGTVDQILMAALVKKFVMLLHLGMAQKVLIIDEVHAYDAYMSSYLRRVLEWAGVYHVPVILLSATLPVLRKREFLQAYLQCDDLSSSVLDLDAYPCVTWSDGQDVYTKPLDYLGFEKSVHIGHVDIDTALKQIEQAEESCVGVIVNSVKRAQILYQVLTERLLNRRIVLLHSRYLSDDRNRKENEVIRLVGKQSNYEIRKGTVIIGTQVLEQSLDLDFDILYTEQCPIDLLFQRMGREFRHDRKDRPVETPYCYIIEDKLSERSAHRLYHKYLINRTDELLKNQVIRIPQDVRMFTEFVYDLDSAEDSLLKDQFIRDCKLEKESKAEGFLLPRPKKDMGLFHLMNYVTDSEQSVRDGFNSVEILLLKKWADGSIGTIDGAVRTLVPSRIDLKQLLNQKLNLPLGILDFDELNSLCKTYPSWLTSGLFEYRTLVLLNEFNQCVLKGKLYEYSVDTGFMEIGKEDYAKV